MADNVDYTPGSGATIAADEVDGVLYQRIKLVQGIDGVAVDVSAEAPLAVELKQNYETNGPLIVTPDTSQQWPVKLQAPDTAGQLRDLKVTPKGELVTAAADHVIYQTTYTGTPSGFTTLIGPIPCEGFVSASVIMMTQPSSGGFLQASFNGVDWISLNAASNSGSGVSTGLYGTGLYTASIPPCAFIRLACSTSNALIQAKFFLALSRTPRPDFVVTRISDAQISDSAQQANSTTLQQLLVGGVDATKRTRALAADGTVNTKSQGATNVQAGAAASTPFYGHVLTSAITRIAPYTYNVDQPAALQSNTRGELQVDQQETRRMLEQQLLAQQAAAMQLLDPNWGFELR